MGVKNYIVSLINTWSGRLGGTPLPRILRSTPLPPTGKNERLLTITVLTYVMYLTPTGKTKGQQ